MRKPDFCPDIPIQWPDPNPDGDAVGGRVAGSQPGQVAPSAVRLSEQQVAVLESDIRADVRGPSVARHMIDRTEHGW